MLGLTLSLAACGGATSPTTTPPANPTPTPNPTPNPAPAPQPAASVTIDTVFVPSPGASPSIVPTATSSITGDHDVAATTVLLAETESAIFTSSDPESHLTNNGTLWAVGDNTVPVDLSDGSITNNGNIISYTETTANFGIGAFDGEIVNNGAVYAISNTGSPAGLYSEGSGERVINSGSIYAETKGAAAWGIVIYGTQADIENSGDIEVASGVSAVGIGLDQGGRIDNSGDILAVPLYAVDGGSDDAFSTGVVFYDGTSNELVNSGSILANVSVAALTAVSITNTSYLGGVMVLSDDNDEIHNSGEIDGPIFLFDGDDLLDSTDGTLDYFVDGGPGNDTLRGSMGADELWGATGDDLLDGNSGDDTLKGEDGDDQLFGGAGDDELNGGFGDDILTDGEGNDWLFGGRGNDTLTSGVGNDGLYGGVGDDYITLQGGDRAEGDFGNDTFVVSDRQFALIDGGAGTDTLILSGETNHWDLGAFTAENSIRNIDIIKLHDNESIAIGVADLQAINSQPTSLTIDAPDSATVYLVGTHWVDEGVAIPGDPHIYSYNGWSLSILGGTNQQMVALTPEGLDGPEAAADAGPPPALDAFDTANEFIEQLYVGENYHILASEAFAFTDVDRGISIGNGSSFTNDGTITVTTSGQDYTKGIFATPNNYTIINNGLLELDVTGGDAIGIDSMNWGTVISSGTIDVETTAGNAFGIKVGAPFDVLGFDNSGTLSVKTSDGDATGVALSSGADMVNSGSIFVNGTTSGTGVYIFNNNQEELTNSGSIIASSHRDGHPSIGVQIEAFSASSIGHVNNSGKIDADIAVQFDDGPRPGHLDYGFAFVDNLVNTGTIIGDVEMQLGNDYVENRGTLSGDVYLGDDDDVFVAYNIVGGIIDGGEGIDVYKIAADPGEFALDFSFFGRLLENMEAIEFSAAGDFAGDITLQDVLDITDDNNQLMILGDAGDSLTSAAEGWVQGADQTIDSNLFHAYTLDMATLLVDADINQTIL